MVWNQLKKHIAPPEVASYEKKIGIARIQRNEDVYNELNLLMQMYNTVQADLDLEIQKKIPSVLTTSTRTLAIQRCVDFLDSLRKEGHIIDADNDQDSEIIRYLKFTKIDRPNSSSPVYVDRVLFKLPESSAPLRASVEEVRNLLDEEYERLSKEVQEMRRAMLNTGEELREARTIEPPTTKSIVRFNKKLQQKDFTVKSIAKNKGSSVNRLRESVKMNRIWE